jgi:hypothetical protein
MWNYRIVNADVDGETSLEIREVYYDRKGNAYGHCTAEVFGDSIQELDSVITSMRSAFDKPILSKEDFIGDPNI